MTIKEVARIAGVSPAAVSRYLNGGPLSGEKRDRIAAAIKETGYRPNLMAQTMRTGKIHQIGVIVPRIYSESVSRLLEGITQETASRDYLSVIGWAGGRAEQEIQYLNILQDNRVAGIILMGTAMDDALRRAIDTMNIPVVVTGQQFKGLPCVYHDDLGAMHELAQRMIAKGYSRIGYIGAREEDEAVGQRRRIGAQKALQEAGMDAGAMPYVVARTFDAVSGYEKMNELLEKHPGLNGVLCATDTLALGAMKALREHGLRIPQDMGIAGIGGSWIDEIPSPTLTSIHYHYRKCGVMAARLLFARIENDVSLPGDQIMLDYDYVEGGSM